MCFRVVFCFEIIAAFCFNLSSSLGQCVVIRPPRCRHHHGLNIVPKHSHYIYREQESERDIEVDFSSLSVMITLRHFNVCKTTTTSRCSYFSISNLPDLSHLPGWWHTWLHIDETYGVEISPKTCVACTGRLFTVISGITI